MARATKQTLKRVLKGAALLAGKLRRGPKATTRILTYHSIGTRGHEMNVTPEDFRQQMYWLAHNTTVISLEEAAHATPGVALTFDDGYRDNLANASPILTELGLPATVFLVAGRMGQFLDHDTPSDAARLLSWDEARELDQLGIELGAHTMEHYRLAGLSETQQRRQVVESKQLLEEHLGKPVKSFAYPFGSAMDYNATSVRVVREAGFSLAVSNRYGPAMPQDARFDLRRIWIDQSDSFASFQAKVRGDLDCLRCMDSPVGIRGRRLINRLLGDG